MQSQYRSVRLQRNVGKVPIRHLRVIDMSRYNIGTWPEIMLKKLSDTQSISHAFWAVLLKPLHFLSSSLFGAKPT